MSRDEGGAIVTILLRRLPRRELDPKKKKAHSEELWGEHVYFCIDEGTGNPIHVNKSRSTSNASLFLKSFAGVEPPQKKQKRETGGSSS